MYPHPHFDLLLHSDEELKTLLGSRVCERVTLHEWPLSCVQRIQLENGHTWFYKSEAGPTVETEFYTSARSPVLPQTRILHRDARYACLVIEAIQDKPLDGLVMSEADAFQTSNMLLADIAAIKGNPPVYLDVSTWERWSALMSGMIEDLNGLVRSGRFEKTRLADISRLATAAFSPALQEAYTIAASKSELGLVHHDLSSDNVFVAPTRRKIIDWQRTIYGLVEIDRVLLLTSLGFDPRPWVHPGISTATDLLHAHWWVECTLTWFPSGEKTYDKMVAEIALKI